ncbi:hypothetical protein MTO96_045238, partial [Rhipicephalus appendiculatus]
RVRVAVVLLIALDCVLEVTHRGNCVPEDTAPKLTRLQKVGGCLHQFEVE